MDPEEYWVRYVEIVPHSNDITISAYTNYSSDVVVLITDNSSKLVGRGEILTEEQANESIVEY